MRATWPRRIVAGAAIAVLAALSTGCGFAPSAPPAGDPDGTGDTYLCRDISIPADRIHEPTRPGDLDEHGRTAIEEATHDDGAPFVLEDPESWIVVVEEENRIVLIQPVGAVDGAEGYGENPGSDHLLIELTTDLWPGWAVGAQSNCALTVDLGRLGVPTIDLDPESPPTSGSRELHLLVHDPNCGGDTDMPDRIEVVRIDESDTEVGLLIGVQPLPGEAYDCEGFPPTPFTIELQEPLGDREIFDDSRALERELTL